MRLLQIAIALAVASVGFADTITLRNGQVVNGTFLGGTARLVRVDVGDQVQTFDITDIVRIEFGGPPPQAPPPPPREEAMAPPPKSAGAGRHAARGHELYHPDD